ncbi:protein of unknown function [Candidatus Hydrogenisulfobacillus filiaventi]|uniref:Uncharacterized protein n=1 Tax=Candidatus Hydrogenisulfobacillus filiaventi TaxID=2707344 RepID=A0A6F8ZGB4_9FIRM|nr:protein of unknown function [Candidatus Hydrogenisulfobacillus filiaventi]
MVAGWAIRCLAAAGNRIYSEHAVRLTAPGRGGPPPEVERRFIGPCGARATALCAVFHHPEAGGGGDA